MLYTFTLSGEFLPIGVKKTPVVREREENDSEGSRSRPN